tara:strand:- start:23963 stop:25219 length:1257 start_codon:yes stop_codon:yes gene_type:complete
VETLKKMMLLVVLALTTNVFAYVDRSEDTSSSLSNKYTGEYLVTALGQSSLNADKVTHIIVVGSSMKKDSDQFLQSGLIQGYKYREMYPSHQVVVITAPDVKGADNDEVFMRFNLPIIKQVDVTLNVYNLVNEMLFFKQIASFDYYGHSSPWAIKLAKKDGTIEPGSHKSTLQKVIPRFTKYAYATLNGCNGGFNIAPELSTVWGIPASGSLTSTQFERLQVDGFYKKSDRDDSQKLSVNTLSFKDALDCKVGVCWRLKTARKNYSSYWGNFKDGGLSFPKFFCNFDNSDKRCEKAMALQLFSFPSVKAIDKNANLEDYKTVLFDYLCSTAKDKNYFKNCVNGIKNAIANNTNRFQAHPGNALQCDFKGCNARIKCKKKIFGSGPRGGSCKVITTVNSNPTTLVREYKAFIEGFQLLK